MRLSACHLGIQTAQGKHSPDDYFAVLNSLFRPLLLDGITMLELAGKTALAQEFTVLQRQFLPFLRGSREELLCRMLSLDRLHDLAEQFAHLIEQQIWQREEL
ncbi:MAG: hypothetical protein IIY94_04435 [Oscillospiraceae bacterium]|nr:hypothetical protein [Oscillospiraceae bacterium]